MGMLLLYPENETAKAMARMAAALVMKMDEGIPTIDVGIDCCICWTAMQRTLHSATTPSRR